MAAQLGLVLDCADPERLAEFWAPALGYLTSGPPAATSLLVDEAGSGPSSSCSGSTNPRPVKNRMHFDIEVADIDRGQPARRARRDAVERRHRASTAPAGWSWPTPRATSSASATAASLTRAEHGRDASRGGEHRAVHRQLPALLLTGQARYRTRSPRGRLRVDRLHDPSPGRRPRPAPPTRPGRPRRHRLGSGMAGPVPRPDRPGARSSAPTCPSTDSHGPLPDRGTGAGERASDVGAARRQPLRWGAFDAVVHTDVLCCLGPKLAVLRACRRLLRLGGRLRSRPSMSAWSRRCAAPPRRTGRTPPRRDPAAVWELVAQAGFGEIAEIDVTEEYAQAQRAWQKGHDAHADELRRVIPTRTSPRPSQPPCDCRHRGRPAPPQPDNRHVTVNTRCSLGPDA